MATMTGHDATVVVNKKGEARVLHGHPWVFRSDVTRAEGAGPGAVVRVIGPYGRPLGFAFFSSRSEIRLRMVARGEVLSPTFLADRLSAAVGGGRRWPRVRRPAASSTARATASRPSWWTATATTS